MQVLTDCDDDQNLLCLQETLKHPKIQPLFSLLRSSWNSEVAQVGKRAVQGMKAFVDRIAEKKTEGGMSKSCRSLLEIFGMIVTGEDDSSTSVLKRAIRRVIFGNLSTGRAHRVMKKGERRKRAFDEEDLRLFNIVEEEEIRRKYSVAYIEAMQHYLLNNDYVWESTKKRDAIFKRNINGKCFGSS